MKNKSKFIIHPELKKRLSNLLNRDVDEGVKKIAKRILDMKEVSTTGKYCNYLGLSNDDFAKISYLDEARLERLHGKSTTKHVIKAGTEVVIHRKRSYIQNADNVTYATTLKLSKRHLSGLTYPIAGFEQKARPFSYYMSGNIIESTFISNMPYLVEGSPVFRISNSRSVRRDEIFIDHNGIGLAGYGIVGLELKKTAVVEKEIWNHEQRYHTSIGKIVRRLFGGEFCDNSICKFAEAYTGMVTICNPNYNLKIAEGEEIRWGYHEDNSYGTGNSLGSSCMRYNHCQSYLDLYVKNTSKIKMAMLMRGKKVAARCILWKFDDGWLYDRVYSNKLEEEHLLTNAMESSGYKKVYSTGKEYSIEVDMDGISEFPYMDSFKYYFPEDGVISTYDTSHCGEYWGLNNTNGTRCIYNSHDEEEEDDETSECPCCDRRVDNCEMTEVDAGRYHGDWVCNDCGIYSPVMDRTFTDRDDRVHDRDGDVMLIDCAVLLYNDEWVHESSEYLASFENDYGYFLTSEDPHYYDEERMMYFHIDDEEKTGIPVNVVEPVII
jgi:hypothetical protein